MTLTALDVLVTDPENADREIADALTESKVLDELPEGAPTLAAPAATYLRGAVAGSIASMLRSIGVDDALMGGWRKLDPVAGAASATAGDGERHVTLLDHEITSVHDPVVEMLMNEVPIPLLRLRLVMSFVVHGCDLLVRGGRIVEAKPSDIAVDGKLECGPTTLLKHTVATLDSSRLFGSAVRTG